MKKILLIGVLFCLLVFRLWLTVNAKHGDMYNNIDWGNGAVKYGLNKVYDVPQATWDHSWPNQPPGSLIMHWISSELNIQTSRTFSFLNDNFKIFPSKLIWWWEFNGELLSIKIPSLIFDFVAAWAIYKLTQKKLLAILYLLNPVSWYISSYWGQTDSIVAGLTLLSILALKNKKLALSSIFLGWSLITKASWAPLVALWLGYVWITYKQQIWKIVYGLIPVVVISFPFHPQIDLLLWLMKLYMYRILPGESGFLTVNAFNFWRLWFLNPQTPETITFWGIKAVYWGYVFVGILVVWLLSKLEKDNLKKFLLAATSLQLGYFLFAPKMHERYSFPAWILFTVYLGFKPKKSNYLVWLIFSLVFLFNVYSLWYSPSSNLLQSLYTPNIILFACFIFIAIFGFVLNQI